jgi:isopenicillin N synthase-like dioxygenase
MNSLPIIDISPFLDPHASEEARLKTARALDSACRTVGFFYLSHHNISVPELSEILSLAHQFFSLPASEKETIKLLPPGVGDGDGGRGYQCIGDNTTQGKRDWHEGLDLYRPVLSAKPPYSLVMGVNKWPPGEFRKVYEMYIDKLLVLGRAVMHAIALGLGEREDYFDGLIDEPFWVMRAIGYPPLESQDDGGISCGEHTGIASSYLGVLIEDYGCLTFLIADAHAKGSLQVKLPATGKWISADPVEGCFVCNIGDMMQVSV